MSDNPSLADAERVLKDLEKEILARIEAAGEMTNAPVMDSAVGRLTYIDAYQQQQVALHGRRQLETQLESVHNALKRVQDGTYGVCASCEKPIPPGRLEVMPETPFCVECQARIVR